MRLTRNITQDGRCKYALVRLDKLREMFGGTACRAIDDLDNLESLGLLEYGKPGSEDEFFAIKLKDVNAPAALDAYAQSASRTDQELSDDVHELFERSRAHPHRKLPD